MKKPINYSIILILILLGTSIFLACEKEDDISFPRRTVSSNASCVESQLEKDFLNYAYASAQNKNLLASTYFTEPKDSLLMLKQIEAIRKTNCSNRSIRDVISAMGYPLWNKANYVDGLSGDGTTHPIIISPLALLAGDTTTAVLFGLFRQNAFEFYYFNKKEIMELYNAGNYTKQDYFSIMSEFQYFDQNLFGKVWEVDTAGYERNEIESRDCIEITYTTCRAQARIIDQNPVSSRSRCPQWYVPVTVTVRHCWGGTIGGGGKGDPCFECDYTTGGSGGGTRNGGGGTGGGGTPGERDTSPPCDKYIPCEWQYSSIYTQRIPTPGFPFFQDCSFSSGVYALGSSCNFKAYVNPPHEQGCAALEYVNDISTADYAGAQNLQIVFNANYRRVSSITIGGGGGGVSGSVGQQSGNYVKVYKKVNEIIRDCYDCLTWCKG